MDHDDPEKRIAELETHLGEAKAPADAQSADAWRPVSDPLQGSQQGLGAGGVVGPQPRGGRPRRPGLGTIVGASLCSLVLVTAGASMFWFAHSGVPARIEVVECQAAGKSVNCTGLWPPGGAPERMIPIADGKWTDVGLDMDVVDDGHSVRVTVVECHVDGESLGCTGVSPPSAVPLQTIRVDGADWSDVGHDIDVHVHQGRVTSVTVDTDDTPYTLFAIGCVAAVFAVIAFVRRLRQPRVERQLAGRGVDLTHSGAGSNVGAMPVSGQQTAPGCFVACAPDEGNATVFEDVRLRPPRRDGVVVGERPGADPVQSAAFNPNCQRMQGVSVVLVYHCVNGQSSSRRLRPLRVLLEVLR